MKVVKFRNNGFPNEQAFMALLLNVGNLWIGVGFM
jgi:hypothetical protein